MADPTLSTVEADIQYGAGILASILEAIAGKGAGSTTASSGSGSSSASVSASIGLDIAPAVTAGLGLATALTKAVSQRDAELNTPAEIQGANAAKLQQLRDHITATLAAAEAAGPGTPQWKALQILLS